MPFVADQVLSGSTEDDILSDIYFDAGEIIWILGLGGADTIISNGAFNRLDGGLGADTISSGGGIVNGGGGNDVIFMTGAGGRITGGNGNDRIFVGDELGSSASVITVFGDNAGELGNQVVGNDTIIGSQGFERVHDGGGDDIIDLRANGIIFAELNSNDGDWYQGSADPADRNEAVTYAQATAAIRLELDSESQDVASGDGIGRDFLFGIDRIVTGKGDDLITGSGGDFIQLETRSGNDYIDINATEATILAGAGDDTVVLSGTSGDTAEIDLGTGLDRVFCSNGTETIVFNAGAAIGRQLATAYVLNFETGVDKMRLLSAVSAEDFLSLAYDDTISGVSGVRFDTASGNTLFLTGLMTAQIDVSDFIV